MSNFPVWRNIDVHVVGLNVDPYSRDMALVCGKQAERRSRRAEKIAKNYSQKIDWVCRWGFRGGERKLPAVVR